MIGAAMLLAGAEMAVGTVIYLNASATGSDNGSSWAGAFTSLPGGRAGSQTR